MNADEIRAWTRQQKRSRDAYRADRLRDEGICVRCETRSSSPGARTCSGCRQAMKRTKGKS